MIKPVRTPRCICGADAPGVTVRSVMRQELSQNMNDVTAHTNINETTGRPEDRKGGKRNRKVCRGRISDPFSGQRCEGSEPF